MCTNALARLDAFLQLSPAAWDERRLYAPRTHRLCCGARTHLAWKLLLAAYALAVSIVNRATQTDPQRYATFLTVHGVWLVVAYFLCSALTAVLALLAPHLLQTPAHRLHARATQLLFAIAVPFQLVIVTLYWLLLATPQPSPFRVWDNIESHGIKFALIWADLLVGAMVLPSPQVLVTLAAALVYLFINLGVTLSTYPVYRVLAWNSGASGVLVVGALLYMVFAFFLAQCLARARDRVARGLRAEAEASEAAGAMYPAEFHDDKQSCASLLDTRCACRSAAYAEPGFDSSASARLTEAAF